MGFFFLVLWALLFTATLPFWRLATMWREALQYLMTPSEWVLAGIPFAFTAVIFLLLQAWIAAVMGRALWTGRLKPASKVGALLWFITLSVFWGTVISEMVLLAFSPATQWSIPLVATWILVTGFFLMISLALPAALANTYGKLGLYRL